MRSPVLPYQPEVLSAAAEIDRQLSRLLDNFSSENQKHRLVRLESPVQDVDLFSWLSHQSHHQKLFWGDRNRASMVAAVGVAHAIVSETSGFPFRRMAEAQRLLQTEPAARFYGGLRFEHTVPDEEWELFGQFSFFLPRFEMIRDGETQKLACNLVFPTDEHEIEKIRSELRTLVFPEEPLVGAFSLPISRENDPKERGWQKKILWLLEAFTKKELHKVVLARRAAFRFPVALNPVLLLKKLYECKPDCFHFFFQPDQGTAFIAATPERLYCRKGQHIMSEAVAGTRPRGSSPLHDMAIAQELLHSEKDLREHNYVHTFIRDALVGLCDTLKTDENASLMTLTRRMHLYARVEGTLKTGIRDADLLRVLHPTPAVGGFPTPEAVSTIAALEPFDRGWYAGPIGWIGAKAAEFAVGIRSGLLRKDTLFLYSGAGIVLGSTPEDEWAEIEQKISDFLEVLGLEV
ncbi:MAG: isochorismate synthase [Rhodothermia bacterium]|nr:isochorismate synthase [Rhodothermia bacterium]